MIDSPRLAIGSEACFSVGVEVESDLWHEDQLLDQIADAVIFADTQGVVRVWNRGAVSLFGFSTGEALGQRLDFLIPAHLREAHWIAFDRAMSTATLVATERVRTTRATHKSGIKVYVDFTFSLVRDRFGKVVGSVAVGRETAPRATPANSDAACVAYRRLTACVPEPSASPHHADRSEDKR